MPAAPAVSGLFFSHLAKMLREIPIGGENAFYFHFGAAVDRIERSRFVAVFTAKLFAAILIMVIFDQVGTATTPTCVRDFIDDHALIIFGIMQL